MGSESSFDMPSSSQHNVLIRVSWCVSYAVHDNKKCCTVFSFLLQASQIGVAVTPML